MLACPICSKPRDARYVNERANEACVDPCHWPYLPATEVARASIALDRIHAARETCHHVNGGEPSVDGWTCDDCGKFFPLGTVVEGQAS